MAYTYHQPVFAHGQLYFLALAQPHAFVSLLTRALSRGTSKKTLSMQASLHRISSTLKSCKIEAKKLHMRPAEIRHSHAPIFCSHLPRQHLRLPSNLAQTTRSHNSPPELYDNFYLHVTSISLRSRRCFLDPIPSKNPKIFKGIMCTFSMESVGGSHTHSCPC